MDNDPVPAAPTTGGAVVPAPSRLPVGPVAGGGASRAIAKSARGNVPTNLAAYSVLDAIGKEMADLNTQLQQLGELLEPLEQTANVIDQVVTNVDERSQLYQAPATTRAATDAASGVGQQMLDMARQARDHAYRAQELNAAAFLALGAMRDVQERERAMGAGPRLLRTAGN